MILEDLGGLEDSRVKSTFFLDINNTTLGLEFLLFLFKKSAVGIIIASRKKF